MEAVLCRSGERHIGAAIDMCKRAGRRSQAVAEFSSAGVAMKGRGQPNPDQFIATVARQSHTHWQPSHCLELQSKSCNCIASVPRKFYAFISTIMQLGRVSLIITHCDILRGVTGDRRSTSPGCLPPISDLLPFNLILHLSGRFEDGVGGI